jgi:hypothetical protein
MELPPRPCPCCGSPLAEVRYPRGSYLNYDQWSGTRAGAYYCRQCPGTRGTTGYRYFWSHELPCPASPEEVQCHGDGAARTPRACGESQGDV